MPEHGSSALRRRQLAAELRRLREQAGYSATEVVSRLGWPSSSKLSRIELNRIGVKEEDLVLLLDLYGTTDPHRAALIALAGEARKVSPLDALTTVVREEHAGFMRREGEALSEWNWESLVIPGLLQTEGYIRAIMTGWVSTLREPSRYIEDRVGGRLLRQKEIMSRRPPLELRLVIDDSVLRRSFGDARVMCEQLEHLAAISESPDLDVRVLPLDINQVLTIGGFAYMTFPPIHDVPVPDLVAVEHLTGTHFIEDEEETAKYRIAFTSLRDRALEPAESRDRIRNTIRDFWAG